MRSEARPVSGPGDLPAWPEEDFSLVLVGLGEVGTRLLYALAADVPDRARVVVISRDEARSKPKVSAARLSASYLERFPDIDLQCLDLSERDRLVDLIGRIRPDIIVNTASRSPWWARGLLPALIRTRLEMVGAGPGLWAPGHLALTARIAAARDEAASDAVLVNAAYPDVVNPALARSGAGRIVGAGNIDLLTPAARRVIARDLGVSAKAVSLTLVAHNFHSSGILTGNPIGSLRPILRTFVDGVDRSGEIDVDDLWRRIPQEAPIPRGSGAAAILVGSMTRMLRGLLSTTAVRTHAPGVAGLPGGYPIFVSRLGATIDLPPEIALDEAVEVNCAGQRAEGIEIIRGDGALVLTETAREVLQSVFGIECEAVLPDEAQEFATRLLASLDELARRYGIHIADFDPHRRTARG